MLEKDKIVKMIKGALWDYNIDPYEYYLVAKGESPSIGFIDQKKAFLRLLERLSWYELIDLFGLEFIKNQLTPSLITKLRGQELKKYEFLRKILQGEIVPFTGWDTETRQRIKSSLLSDRWNRT